MLNPTSTIRYSSGVDKFDNLPNQLVAKDFNEFTDKVLAKRSPRKGETYFCSAFSYGPHKDTKEYPRNDHYRLGTLVEPKRFLVLDFDGFKDVAAFNLTFAAIEVFSGFGYTTWSHKHDAPRVRAVLELDREVTRDEGMKIGAAFQDKLIAIIGGGAAVFDESVYRSEQPVYGPPPLAHTFRFGGKKLVEADHFIKRFDAKLKTSLPTQVTRSNTTTASKTAYSKLVPASLEIVLAKINYSDEKIWSDVANALARVYGESGRDYFITFSEGTYAGSAYPDFDIDVVNERFDRALSEVALKPNGVGIRRLCTLAGLDPVTLEFEQEPPSPEAAAFFASLPGYLKPNNEQLLSGEDEVEHEADIELFFPELNKQKKPSQVTDNVKAVLASKRIIVRYNQIKKGTEVLIPGMKCVLDERDNTSLTLLTDEVVKAGMSPGRVDEMTAAIAAQNPYCPVQTYIESVPWDGVSRIADFCKQITTPDVSMAHFLITKWLLQAVAAVYETNGLSGAGVLVFTGAQAEGKTRLFRDLTSEVSDVFLEGAILNPDDKDSVFTACSHWIVELGELDATFKKSDIAQLKAFLTKSVDTLRKPYAKKDSTFPRRTVFAGTVNDFEFLQDPTGNRRFWPIEVTLVSRDTKINYQQLWAEVKTIYDSGESWHLSKAELVRLNQHSEQFTVMDPVVEMLLKKYDFAGCTKWQEKLMVDICSDIYLDRPTRGDMQKLASAIKKYNGNQKPRQSNGKKYHYVPELKLNVGATKNIL
jgi:putative DNA primase/helicase